MTDNKQKLTIGYGTNGITGPTTPAGPSPVCGGASWPYEIVTRGYETVAIFPAQNIGGFGCPEHDIEQARSYARKFSAVDDLLAALKLAKEHAELEDEILDIVDSAINKAEGK